MPWLYSAWFFAGLAVATVGGFASIAGNRQLSYVTAGAMRCVSESLIDHARPRSEECTTTMNPRRLARRLPMAIGAPAAVFTLALAGTTPASAAPTPNAFQRPALQAVTGSQLVAQYRGMQSGTMRPV